MRETIDPFTGHETEFRRQWRPQMEFGNESANALRVPHRFPGNYGRLITLAQALYRGVEKQPVGVAQDAGDAFGKRAFF